MNVPNLAGAICGKERLPLAVLGVGGYGQRRGGSFCLEPGRGAACNSPT